MDMVFFVGHHSQSFLPPIGGVTFYQVESNDRATVKVMLTLMNRYFHLQPACVTVHLGVTFRSIGYVPGAPGSRQGQ